MTLADDERFMREAISEARLAASKGEVPIGAVVVYEGRVVARAHNRRELDEDPSAHAEFSAMVAASKELGRWRLTGCTVYVTLEPCVMCAGLMVNARVDRCVYGATDPKAGAMGSLYRVGQDGRLNHELEVSAGVLAGECGQILSEFFRTLRRERALDPVAEEDGVLAGAAHAAHLEKRDRTVVSLPAGRTSSSARAPRVLLAVDSFKGSATSEQAERWLSEGVRCACPDARVDEIPLADGGEGTVAAIARAVDGVMRSVVVHDAFGREVEAEYLMSATGVAVVELASAAGIEFSDRTHASALRASTYGVGEMVAAAVAAGAHQVLLGLGGSATTDGGAGFLSALGARLLDEDGDEVGPGLTGLARACSVDLSSARDILGGVELIALTDVDNPLVGRRGCVRVFGAQKGLADLPTPRERTATFYDEADQWMISYARLLDAARAEAPAPAAGARRFRAVAGVPGAGAAGGVGAAVLALGGRLESGIEAMLDIVGFDEAAQRADLVVTGEGMIDGQTAAGKAPVGVARRAKRFGKPVVAVVGGRAHSLRAVYDAGIDLVIPAVRRPMALERAMEPAEVRRNLVCAGETAVRAYLLGTSAR